MTLQDHEANAGIFQLSNQLLPVPPPLPVSIKRRKHKAFPWYCCTVLLQFGHHGFAHVALDCCSLDSNWHHFGLVLAMHIGCKLGFVDIVGWVATTNLWQGSCRHRPHRAELQANSSNQILLGRVRGESSLIITAPADGMGVEGTQIESCNSKSVTALGVEGRSNC
jgi:hypothetical protein